MGNGILKYLLFALAGYVSGSIMYSYLIPKLFCGVDIVKEGEDHNPGMTNVMRCVSVKLGVLCLLLDVAKGFAPVFLAKLYVPDFKNMLFALVIAAPVLGHAFTPILKFKGGKGFASYLGMILAINWKVALCILAAVVILTVLTDYIVVGTVTSVVSFPIYTAIRSGWLPLVILCVATLAILIKHRENFVRIWNGTEMGLSSAGRGKYKMK